MDQVVSCQQRRFERLFHPFHRCLGRPLLGALLIFEPRTAVVDGHDVNAVEIDGSGLHAYELHELVGLHPRVTAVAVDLVERRGEIDWCVVALGGAEGGLDDRRRIGAGGEERAADAGFTLQFVDALQQFFGFCHNCQCWASCRRASARERLLYGGIRPPHAFSGLRSPCGLSTCRNYRLINITLLKNSLRSRMTPNALSASDSGKRCEMSGRTSMRCDAMASSAVRHSLHTSL